MSRRLSRRRAARQRFSQLAFESLESKRMLTAWHNLEMPSDVNDSGAVSAQDAITIVNELIRGQNGNPQYVTDGSLTLPTDRPGDAPFLDVNDDGVLAATDIIPVVNDIPRTQPVDPDPDPTDNEFFIEENVGANTLVGRINPSSNVTDDTRFELAKDDELPADISEALELKPDDHYIGAADASVLVIEYVDFACPICGIFHPLNQQALEDFSGDVAYVTRHFPLSTIHPNAIDAAVAAEAAGRQGLFDEMADLLFTRRTQTQWDDLSNPTPVFRSFANELGLNLSQFDSDLADPALEARVLRDQSEAVSVLGLGGTPSFIINDQLANIQPSQASLNGFIQSSMNVVELPFTIDRFTGEVRVREGTTLDFESQSSYTFDVLVNGTVERIDVRLIDVAGV